MPMCSKSGCWTFLALSAAVLPAFASPEKFPAADFKPTVIYRDAELIKSYGASKPAAAEAVHHAPDPKYPAAYFTPTVIHSALPAIPAEPTKPDHHEEDPDYPAAYFNPTVIYPSK